MGLCGPLWPEICVVACALRARASVWRQRDSLRCLCAPNLSCSLSVHCLRGPAALRVFLHANAAQCSQAVSLRPNALAPSHRAPNGAPLVPLCWRRPALRVAPMRISLHVAGPKLRLHLGAPSLSGAVGARPAHSAQTLPLNSAPNSLSHFPTGSTRKLAGRPADCN